MLLDTVGRTIVHPYRRDDPQNLPLQNARARFLEALAKRTGILEALVRKLLPRWEALLPATQQAAKAGGWRAVASIVKPRGPRKEANRTRAVGQELGNLRNALQDFALESNLVLSGEPAEWAMDTLIETLAHAAGHAEWRQQPRWVHSVKSPEPYPVVTDDGLVNPAAAGVREELTTRVPPIEPKQPDEKVRDYQRRVARTLREAKKEAARNLEKAAEWRITPQLKNWEWIDWLAKWQAGLKQSGIDPRIASLPTLEAKQKARAMLSQAIRTAGDHIGITPRKAGHGPRRRH